MRKRRSLAERFAEKHIPEPNSGCWLWTAHLDECGYGRIQVDNAGKLASRISLALVGRPLPDGLFALHHCDTPACVNPDHLYAGTRADNAADSIRRGRTTRGEKSAVAKLTWQQAEEIRAASRTGTSTTKLARDYGVAVKTVYRIKIGATWQHYESN